MIDIEYLPDYLPDIRKCKYEDYRRTFDKLKLTRIVKVFNITDDDLLSITYLFDNYILYNEFEEKFRESSSKKIVNKTLNNLHSGIKKALTAFEEVMFNPYLQMELMSKYYLLREKYQPMEQMYPIFNYDKKKGMFHKYKITTEEDLFKQFPSMISQLFLLEIACDTFCNSNDKLPSYNTGVKKQAINNGILLRLAEIIDHYFDSGLSKMKKGEYLQDLLLLVGIEYDVGHIQNVLTRLK